MIWMMVGAAAALGGYFLLASVTPAEARRGVITAVVIAVQFIAGSQVVPTEIADGSLVFSYLILGLVILAPRTGPIRRSLVPQLVVLFWVTAIITTRFAGTTGTATQLKLAVLSILLSIVVVQFSSRDLAALLDGLLAGALLQVAFGAIELVMHQPVLWGYKTYTDGKVLYNENPFFDGSLLRVQGSAGHWIPYGTMLAAGLIALVLGWRRYRLPVRIVAIVTLPLFLVLAGTRSVIIGVGVVIVYLLLTSRTRHALVRNIVVGVTAIGAAILAAAEIADLVGELVLTGSWVNRLGNVAAAPNLVGRPPLVALFGSGADSEPSLFAKDVLFQTGYNVVDNQFITTLATQGVLGLVLLVAMFVLAFRRGGRSGRAMLVLIVILAFSFDYLKFTPVVCLIFVFLALARRDTDEAVVSGDPGAHNAADRSDIAPTRLASP